MTRTTPPTSQGAVEQVVHAQFLGDGHGVIVAVAEFRGGRLRHDLQLEIACQREAQFLGQGRRKDSPGLGSPLRFSNGSTATLLPLVGHGREPRSSRCAIASRPARTQATAAAVASSSRGGTTLVTRRRCVLVGAGGRACGSPTAAAVGARPMTAATPRTMLTIFGRVGVSLPAQQIDGQVLAKSHRRPRAVDETGTSLRISRPWRGLVQHPVRRDRGADQATMTASQSPGPLRPTWRRRAAFDQRVPPYSWIPPCSRAAAAGAHGAWSARA